MRALFLTRYGCLGSSSRVRALQFLPALEAAGWQTDVVPLLDDAYVRRFNAGLPRDQRALVAAYARRLAFLVRLPQYDVVWVEKELFPMVPASVERALLRKQQVVIDYDDATFHSYDLHSNRGVRRLLGDKIARLVRAAALVVAGNEYLAAYACRSGAPRVEILPSVVDLDRYGPVAPEAPGPFTVGWIGSPGSENVLESFREVAREVATWPDARVVLVGASDRALRGIPHERWAWSEETEVEAMRAFHVGVMPLPDEPWERGKCGFKLIQCMGVGRPVVASPVGANVEIVRDGIEGFHATDPASWIAALERLHHDAALRARMGAAGHARVASHYSVQEAAPRLIHLLESLDS